MRDAINPIEEQRLVDMLLAGYTWDEVRGSLPGVDPVALDHGFKERCFRAAGLTVIPTPAEVPPDKTAKKRGDK